MAHSVEGQRWWTELDGLTHVERMVRLCELGRQAAAGEAEAVERIAQARSSADGYARSLALATVFGSRDGALVLAALDDPSRTVRRRALGMLPLACDDEACAAAFERLRGQQARSRLVKRLARIRRQGAVDGYLSAALAEAQADGVVRDLLGYASAELAAELLARHAELLSAVGWSRLARSHPALVVEHFRSKRGADGQLDARTKWTAGQVLRPLCQASAETALPLVEALLTSGSAPKHWLTGPLRELVRQAPQATFDVLRRLRESTRPVPPPGAFGAVRFDKVAHRLGAERLAYLIEHAWSTLSDGRRAKRWFLRLSEAEQRQVVDTWLDRGQGAWGAFLLRHVGAEDPRRERAYRRWSAAAQDRDGTISTGQLILLPADLRAREAQRHLEAVEALATKPAQRIAYAALQSWDDARTTLEPWLSHPEGEMRAVALRALLAVPEHTPAALDQALETALSRRFEQDPVRLAMLGTLAGLPLRCFRREQLEVLGQIFQHALDAADLSHLTSTAMEQLTVRLFRLDAPWAAGWLCRLLAVRGMPSALGLVEGLLPDEVRALAPAVEGLCRLWTHRERAGALLWLAHSFGARLPLVPALQQALERLALEQPFVQVAATALELLRRHVPARFTEVAVQLLADDRSSILIRPVARHVSTRRQDLLRPFLAGRKMKGRFASGRTHWVIDFEVGEGTWTAEQQTAQSNAWTALLSEKKRDVPTLRNALSGLSRLAFAPQAALIPFASDPRPPVREMAVRALPHLDDGSGIPVLVECLGDDRARWAIYALRRSLSEMSQGEVVAALESVALDKVTVAKEVVRLLGELGGAAGFDRLVSLDRASMHRDVRIALLRALWDHLEHAATWTIFEEALTDPDWVVASRLADVPLGRLDPALDRQVAGLMARILERPEPEARLDLLRRAAALPLRDDERKLFHAALAHLAAPHRDEAEAALGAVLHRMGHGDVDRVVQRLIALTKAPRQIDPLLERLPRFVGPYAKPAVLAVGQEVLRAIGREVQLTVHRIRLAGALLEWAGLAEHLVSVSQARLLHYDAMVAAVAAIERCVHPDLLERELSGQDDPQLRRLGLAALTVASKPKRGWSKDRRRRLERYQQDADPLVSSAAAFVFPPEKARPAR